MISSSYIRFLRTHFALDWDGIHGAPHWARVKRNGLLLAEHTGADVSVIEVFAFIHDAERQNDDYDPDHGRRAAALARQLNDQFFSLDTDQLDLLTEACEGHSNGHLDADITIQTCWDADRLDLGRVGIRPCPTRLCTSAARSGQILEAAFRRSLG